MYYYYYVVWYISNYCTQQKNGKSHRWINNNGFGFYSDVFEHT